MMIKVVEGQKYRTCSSCGTDKNVVAIQASMDGQSWMSIGACKNCRHTLACKLLTIVLQDRRRMNDEGD